MLKLGQGEVTQNLHVKRWEITNLVGVPDQMNHVYDQINHVKLYPPPHNFMRDTPINFLI